MIDAYSGPERLISLTHLPRGEFSTDVQLHIHGKNALSLLLNTFKYHVYMCLSKPLVLAADLSLSPEVLPSRL